VRGDKWDDMKPDEGKEGLCRMRMAVLASKLKVERFSGCAGISLSIPSHTRHPACCKLFNYSAITQF